MSICYFVFYDNIINKLRKDKRIIELHNNTTPKDNRKAYLSASATLEASLVIPIFIYAVIMVTYMIQIISVKSSIMHSMYDTARELSAYSYIYESMVSKDVDDLSKQFEEKDDLKQVLHMGITDVYAKTLLLSKLGENFCKNSNIIGENIGLSLLESEYLKQDHDIKLVVRYTIRNPLDFLGVSDCSIKQVFVTKAWLGEDVQKGKDNTTDDQTVYITESGTVYHLDKNCTYLNISITGVPFVSIEALRNASGGKYYECEVCGKNGVGQQVYITHYGDRYHTTPNCSKLRRTVIAIPISKVGDRRACSKCGGG